MAILYKWGKYSTNKVLSHYTVAYSSSPSASRGGIGVSYYTITEDGKFNLSGEVKAIGTGSTFVGLETVYGDFADSDIGRTVNVTVPGPISEVTIYKPAIDSTGAYGTSSMLYTKPVYKDAKGSFIENVTSENQSAYPTDGILSGYWYIYLGVANRPPTISGNDLDLGSKIYNFNISYMVSDADSNDVVEVKIVSDDTVIQNYTATTVNINKTISIDLSKYTLGQHKIIIYAKDKFGAEAVRTYTFTKVNSAPTISGADADLGGKSTAFTIKYQVEDKNADSITVVEKFNGIEIKRLDNAPQKADISLTITEQMLLGLKVGDVNTIEISASDGKGGITYRRYTFKRDNYPPLISGSDSDLGQLASELIYKYSIADPEKDAVKTTVMLDDKYLKQNEPTTLDQEYTISIKGLDFLKLKKGQHTLKITAIDAVGGKSVRIVTFTRGFNELVMQLKEPVITDIAATKVLVIPGWEVAKGAIGKVEVCNNAFDSVINWEDATSMTNAGKAYNFINKTKTASQWGVLIKLTIQRGTALNDSFITGIGGAVE